MRDALLLVGGGLLTIIGGVIATTYQHRLATRAAEAADAREWRQRAAAAFAEAATLATEADPRTIAGSFRLETTPERFIGLRIGSAKVRSALSSVAYGHPDPVVRDVARELDVMLYNGLVATTSVLVDLMKTGKTDPERLANAEQFHQEVTALLTTAAPAALHPATDSPPR